MAIPEDAAGLKANTFYHIIISIPIVIGVLESILFLFVLRIDSPRFLYFGGKEAEAKMALGRIYGSDEGVNVIVTAYQ